MQERSLTVLEFPKVLAYLAGHAVSEAGSRACLSLQPEASREALLQASQIYDLGATWLTVSGFALTSFPDVDPAFQALEKPQHILDLDALWAVRQFLEQAASARQSLREKAVDPQETLQQAMVPAMMPEKSMSALRRCVNDEGLIRDEASPELAALRGEIRAIHRQCNRKVGDFVKQYELKHYLQDEFVTLSSDRYVLPLKSNFKGRFQGIIHDYSQTGETCYFEPLFLVELNNRLQELKRDEKEEERKILRYISSLLRDEMPLLRKTFSFLVRLDVLQAKVRLAASYDGRLVSFEEHAVINLRAARHPLLAIASGARPGAASALESAQPVSQKAPVPSDIMLNPGQRALIISGGNAGGKTVCLKTLGLIALMGMCAIPTPVGPGSSLPFWRSILPFIGDDQSLEDHVSTFTAQINLLSTNWTSIDSDTLIILDEFGAGTDPAQGAALAQAVVDELLEKQACVFAATHFPALKAYALTKPGVRAASVLFDPKSKKPLYKLVYDQVGSSQALEVAREHGLPEAVLKRAEQYLLLDGDDTGRLVARLNELAVTREREAANLRDEARQYRDKRNALDERYQKERAKLHEEVQAQSQAVLREWKSGKATAKQTLKALSGIRKFVDASPATGKDRAVDSDLDLAQVRLGESLLYLPWNKNGVILEIDLRKNRLRADFSGITMWANANDFSKTRTGHNQKEAAYPVQHIKSADNFSLRLDLRGKRADVALAEMEHFLDSAIISGRECVEVLHGRGTGALRREVHAALKRNPAVLSFELAPEDQGGDGLTVVHLK